MRFHPRHSSKYTKIYGVNRAILRQAIGMNRTFDASRKVKVKKVHTSKYIRIYGVTLMELLGAIRTNRGSL